MKRTVLFSNILLRSNKTSLWRQAVLCNKHFNSLFEHKNYLTVLVKNKTNVEQKNSNTKPNTPNTKGTRADRGDLGAPAFGKSWKFKTGKV